MTWLAEKTPTSPCREVQGPGVGFRGQRDPGPSAKPGQGKVLGLVFRGEGFT